MNFKKGILTMVFTLLYIILSSQVKPKNLPGDSILPSSKADLEKLISYDKGNFKYKVEDYFATPNALSFLFSPDGRYLSYKEKDIQSKNHIYVKELNTGKITKAIVENDDVIGGYG